LPVTLNAGVGRPITTENALPVSFWQFRQWQTPVKIGSVSAAKLTAPQRQLPFIIGIVHSILCTGWNVT
jgi:hypothetical protein